jgi:hypothetical protein
MKTLERNFQWAWLNALLNAWPLCLDKHRLEAERPLRHHLQAADGCVGCGGCQRPKPRASHWLDKGYSLSEDEWFYGHGVEEDLPIVLPFWVWAIVWGFAIAAAFYSLRADAENVRTLVYSDPQVTLRLLNQPCTSELVLPHLKAEVRPKYQAAILVWEGRTLQSCWRLTQDRHVLSMDEEGDELRPYPQIEQFQVEQLETDKKL